MNGIPAVFQQRGRSSNEAQRLDLEKEIPIRPCTTLYCSEAMYVQHPLYRGSNNPFGCSRDDGSNLRIASMTAWTPSPIECSSRRNIDNAEPDGRCDK